jgi:hypothetical protein
LDARSNCTPRTAKVLKATVLDKTDKQREKITRGDCIWTMKKPFHLFGFFLLLPHAIRRIATEGRMCDAIESEVRRAWI